MNTFEKIGNVLCIILSWLLSIVLVVMLILSPVMLSALSLLNANTITKVVTDTLTQSLLPEAQKDAAGDYSLTKLSNTSQPANAVGDALKGILGDNATPELVEQILSSKMAKEFIKTYTGDLTNVLTGSDKAPQLDAEKVKAIVKDNIDEIVAIAKEIKPDLSADDIEKLKSEITKAVDEKAEELVLALPKPEELKNSLMESSPELRTAFDILAAKNTIKLAVIGVIVLLSVLIFACRLWGFRGFRWLAVDLFVGGGFNMLICLGLLVGRSVIGQLTADEPIDAALAGSLLSAFTTGMLIRTVVMLVAGGGLLTAYIFIKKVRNMKTADVYDIIVLAGQSNAEGQGIGEVTEEYVPDERVHIMKDDTNFKFVTKDGVSTLTGKWPAENTISVAEERTHSTKGKVGCFGLWFAKKYADEYLEKGRKVLIVNANFGGTGFARPEWGIGNIMHERMIAMTKYALALNKKNRVVAVLWAQGEHDSFENADWDPEKRYTTHKKNLTDTFNDFYEKLGDKSVPIIACGFPDTFCQSIPEATDAVLRAIKEVIADFGGAYVDTAGLPSNAQKVGGGDIYHYCKESLRILGGKFFEKYAQLRSAVKAGK